jgi:hypothetical protein
MKKHAGHFTSDDPRIGHGRPAGSCNHRTKFLAALKAQSDTEEDFIQKILEQAKDGSSTALTICATRLWKEPKATLPSFELPKTNSKEENATNIIQAMVTGQVSPDWAASAMAVLRTGAELTEIKELLQIVKELEGK